MKRKSIIESIKLLNEIEPSLKKFLELNNVQYPDNSKFTPEEYYQMYVLDRFQIFRGGLSLPYSKS